MHYVGVESAEIAKERVRYRVEQGGHGIPEEDIERRYYESLNNLKDVINICDEVNIFDNTTVFKEIMNFEYGNLIWKDNIIPEWAINII